jgi:hypothetical protein
LNGLVDCIELDLGVLIVGITDNTNETLVAALANSDGLSEERITAT